MSARFCWEVVRPANARHFAHGTSNDQRTLEETFDETISTVDIPTLRAMHRATGLKESLWGEMADTLQTLQEIEGAGATEIKVWVEY